MKKAFFPLSLLVILLTSCNNADPKKMANDLCDCVTTKKKLSSQSKKIIMKAAKSKDEFQTTVQTEIAAIEDEEKRDAVTEEIDNFFKVVQSDKTKQCAEKIDARYKVTQAEEKQMQKKMVDEMQDVEGCEAYAAMVKLGLSRKGITNDEETTTDEETDKPKKKKATEEEQ